MQYKAEVKNMPGIKRDFYMVCPRCWSVRVKNRILKNPRYKCELCKHEFNSKIRISYEQRKLFNDLRSHYRINDIEVRIICAKETRELNHV